MREWLLYKGYAFKGTSDSEIIPNLYQELGLSFIHKLEGMFAIALYDKRKGDFFLFRDRFGIKPLYYYNDKIN